MATVDYIADWAQRLRSRLYTQFRDAETWQQWCDEVLGPQFQDLEDAAQTLLAILDIDASSGVTLDLIGRIIGQPRFGLDDPSYRLYLRARILANLSTGTPEDIFDVFRALLGEDASPTYEGGWVKQFAIRIGAAIDRADAMAGVQFLGDSKEAGARGLFEWIEQAESATFAFAVDTQVRQRALIGDNFTLQCVDNSFFPGGAASPTAGSEEIFQAILDPHMANQETISCWVPSGDKDTLRLSATVLAFNHEVGSVVLLTGSVLNVGLGFDQGAFAGAKQA